LFATCPLPTQKWANLGYKKCLIHAVFRYLRGPEFWFGTKRSQVQILSPRPRINEIAITQSGVVAILSYYGQEIWLWQAYSHNIENKGGSKVI
jgi:hypothetical protein